MRLHVTLLAVAVSCLLAQTTWAAADNFEDNDFAEFEDFDDDEFVVGNAAGGAANQHQQQQQQQEGAPAVNTPEDDGNDFAEIDGNDEDEAVVEDEENEFEHFQDEEEFEGFAGTAAEQDEIKLSDAKKTEPKLTMAKVPMHFRTHWDSYWMEMLMLAGLLAYFANYLFGNKKNSSLASLWLSTHKSLLEDNFVLVGDDGKKETEGSTLSFIKESESVYTLWCSGRTCCEGMLVELKMIKRQDLVSLIAGIMKPVQDQLHIKVEMSQDAMDNFVFCVATRKQAAKMFKEMNDLNKFCTLVNKADEKYNCPGYSLLSEIAEASSSLLDSRLVAALNKFSHLIEYIHVSDQYSGPIQQEDPNTLKQPEVKRILHCGFNMPAKLDMEEMKPLLVLVLYLMERVRRFRLSKEGKAKSDKNRARVEEEFMKNTHAARAEAAAQRREEKRKAEKEKVLANEDPEKQRRWEEKERKRLEKKRPKMKQLSIKAL
ncbi:coiled-coil domain-containing protein 47 [Culex quinquefasciatus]|uniref:coiled-coil domain-containing protein 47 n=1 Tax=Culex quinquefasciatus TaxID=7176 RepID=UPI0018E39321|nr:coiled-coil domain-containing protein 47 [Culex quinquefasciatus]